MPKPIRIKRIKNGEGKTIGMVHCPAIGCMVMVELNCRFCDYCLGISNETVKCSYLDKWLKEIMRTYRKR